MTAPQDETVRRMFGAVAPKYDLANTVLSLGIHYGWRRKLVRWSGVKPTQQVLDCATGTGDLAFEFEIRMGAMGTVIGTDFCEEMLVQARRKASESQSGVRFELADATRLPFETGSFDIAAISFGIRNVSDPKLGLSELGRVVRPGGHVLVLEFGQPTLPVFGSLYRFYSRRVLPALGGWVSGEPQAYRYLQESSAVFPCRERFLELAASTGMYDAMGYRSLSGGIAYLYKLRAGPGIKFPIRRSDRDEI